MADLQRLLPYDNALDEQLQDCLLLRERRRVEARADPRAEGRQIGEHDLGGRRFLPSADLLFPLRNQCPPPHRELLAPRTEFLQADDLRLIGIDEAARLAVQPLELRFELVRLGLLAGIALAGELGEVLELREEPLRIAQELADMVPDRRL